MEKFLIIDYIRKNVRQVLFENALSNLKFKTDNSTSRKLLTELHQTVLRELTLSTQNAVDLNGNEYKGTFTVETYTYNYEVGKLNFNPYESSSFYVVEFSEVGNPSPNKNIPTGNAKQNYIKILSTMYKVLFNFADKVKPEYIGISSMNESGYWNIYNTLTKTNILPGYSRKNSSLRFNIDGSRGKMIVLKKNKVQK
jgi:hypothetical protein